MVKIYKNMLYIQYCGETLIMTIRSLNRLIKLKRKYSINENILEKYDLEENLICSAKEQCIFKKTNIFVPLTHHNYWHPPFHTF